MWTIRSNNNYKDNASLVLHTFILLNIFFFPWISSITITQFGSSQFSCSTMTSLFCIPCKEGTKEERPTNKIEKNNFEKKKQLQGFHNTQHSHSPSSCCVSSWLPTLKVVGIFNADKSPRGGGREGEETRIMKTLWRIKKKIKRKKRQRKNPTVFPPNKREAFFPLTGPQIFFQNVSQQLLCLENESKEKKGEWSKENNGNQEKCPQPCFVACNAGKMSCAIRPYSWHLRWIYVK